MLYNGSLQLLICPLRTLAFSSIGSDCPCMIFRLHLSGGGLQLPSVGEYWHFVIQHPLQIFYCQITVVYQFLRIVLKLKEIASMPVRNMPENASFSQSHAVLFSLENFDWLTLQGYCVFIPQTSVKQASTCKTSFLSGRWNWLPCAVDYHLKCLCSVLSQ